MSVYFDPLLVAALLLGALVQALLIRGERAQLLWSSFVSIGILATLHPIFAVVLIGTSWCVHEMVRRFHDERISGGRLLGVGLVGCAVILAIGKYGPDAVHELLPPDDPVAQFILMPLGISYFVFRTVQYVFDHRRHVLKETSFLRLLAFLSFLPVLPAGPLEPYQSFYAKRTGQVTRSDLAFALRRIVWGYFKKTVVVDLLIAGAFGNLFVFVQEPELYGPGGVPPLHYVAFGIATFLRAYVDLSAYTDLAVGFARLFGCPVMENFNRPLWRRNLSEFWNSWHISLSTWCRNNVYFPVFGMTRKVWLGLYASMMTMGLWHYVNLNWFTWAIYHGTGLLVVARWSQYVKKNKPLKKRLKQPVFHPIGCVITFLYVAAGYSFVGTHDFLTGCRVFVGFVSAPIRLLAGI